MGDLEYVHQQLRELERVRSQPSDVWGPVVWGILHSVVREIPCAPCREEGLTLLSGIHDVVNVHLGKPIHSPESLCRTAAQAVAAARQLTMCHLEAMR